MHLSPNSILQELAFGLLITAEAIMISGWATTADHSGGVYLGKLHQPPGIATVGSYQSTIGGLTDGFLTKI